MSEKFGTVGGPAFPLPGPDTVHFGMSLLDYFAAHALAGMLANCPMVPVAAATEAYRHADAMLKERAR